MLQTNQLRKQNARTITNSQRKKHGEKNKPIRILKKHTQELPPPETILEKGCSFSPKYNFLQTSVDSYEKTTSKTVQTFSSGLVVR